jgi:hypothetical protein
MTEVADALTQLRSSHEPPPPSVFAHDLFKLPIRLEEEILVPMPEISPSEDNPQPVSGTPAGKVGPALTSEVNPGTLTGHIEPN